MKDQGERTPDVTPRELTPEEIIRTTKGSFAMEGQYADEVDEKNMMDVLTGRRSLEEVIEEIKRGARRG